MLLPFVLLMALGFVYLLGNIAICPYVPLTDSLIDFFYYKINLINQTTKDNIMLKIAIYYWFNPYRGYEWPLYLKSVLCV